MASGRVLEPNVYRYANDTAATYGLAHKEASLTFFLQSRDAPTLAQELQKYQKMLRGLLSKRHRVTRQALRSFIETILFFQERLEASKRGDALAKALLQSLSVIPALRTQWNMLQEMARTDEHDNNNTTAKGPTPSTLVIPWERLELQLQRKAATAVRRIYQRRAAATTTTSKQLMPLQAPSSLPIPRPLLLSQGPHQSIGEHIVNATGETTKDPDKHTSQEESTTIMGTQYNTQRNASATL